MTPAVFYKFTHPSPTVLTLLAYDLDTMAYIVDHSPVIIDLLQPGAVHRIHSWLQYFKQRVVLITNGASYHYPLLQKLMGDSVDTYINPSHIDVNGLAQFLNACTPCIFNPDGMPASSIGAQMHTFNITDSAVSFPAAAKEYTDLLNVVTVFMYHIKYAQTGGQ